MQYKGKIIYIWEEQTVGKNNLRKKTFVLEEISDKQYKGSIVIDLIKDKVDLIKDCVEWDVVTAELNFRANEYNGKWYNGISAWKIDVQDSTSWDLPF